MVVQALMGGVVWERGPIRRGTGMVLLKMLAIAGMAGWLVSRHQQFLPSALLAQPGVVTIRLVGLALGISLLTLAIAGRQLQLLLRPRQFMLSYPPVSPPRRTERGHGG